MPKRRHFKGIAHNILHTFTASDSFGPCEWRMRTLFKHAQEHGTNKVTIDLINPNIFPKGEVLKYEILSTHEKLLLQVQNVNIPIDWLKEAHISVNFKPFTQRNKPTQIGLNQYCEYSIELVSDLGRKYTSSLREEI